jgi:hypothetical protein
VTAHSASLMLFVSIVVMSVTMIVLSIVAVFMTMIVLSIVAVFMTMIILSIVSAALVIRLVFRGSYEVDRPITRIVLSAVLAPIAGMPGRHV